MNRKEEESVDYHLAFMLGPQELIMLLIIAVLIFGPTRIPEIGKALGEGIRNLKAAQNEDPTANKTPNDNQNSAAVEK